MLEKLRLLQYVNLVEYVHWEDHAFRVPVLGGMGTANLFELELYQVEVLSRLSPFVEKGFVDVGVNVGQTLLCLKRAVPRAAYLGFEPNPACVTYVRRLVEANGFSDLTVVPSGLYREAGVVILESYWNTSTDSTASIVPQVREGARVRRRDTVTILSMDDVERSLGKVKVGAMRIDVEGGELEVVEGMVRLLDRERPVVMIEVLPVYHAGPSGRLSRQLQLEAEFRKIRYRWYRLMRNPDTSLKELQRIQEIGVHDKVEWSNYLAVPEEAVEQIEHAFPLVRRCSRPHGSVVI